MSISIDLLNPFPSYKKLRDDETIQQTTEVNHPLIMNQEPIRMFHFFRYEDVTRIMKDYETFSSEILPTEHPFAKSMLFVDPPYHRKLRLVVSHLFTPKAVARVETSIRNIVNDLLDKIESKNSMSVSADLSVPLPTYVIADLLGIPQEDKEQFKIWADWCLQQEPLPDGRNAMQAATEEMGPYFYQIVQDRKANPREDLISEIVKAEVDGQSLDPTEVLGFCMLLLIAGNETTTNFIINALKVLDENPQVIEDLYKDPSIVDKVVDELLRIAPPSKVFYRKVTKDVVVAGQELKAGDCAMVYIGSANRDERKFPNPDVFDPNRPNLKDHIAFGHGIHLCIGAPLARMEVKIALEELVRRFTNIHVDPTAKLVPLESFMMWSMKDLILTFEKRQIFVR